MRRRDIGELHVFEPFERLGSQALPVDGDRNHVSAGGGKDPARHDVTGILHRDPAAGIGKHAGGKVQPCCEPLTMMIWSGAHLSPRARQR